MYTYERRIPNVPQSTLRQTIFCLVDVENVGNRWIHFLPQDWALKVYLFFSYPSPNLTYSDINSIFQSKADVTPFECMAGKNAIDFQLSSYLGFLIASASPLDRFVILSGDQGLDSTCLFWAAKGYWVERMGPESVTAVIDASAPLPSLPASHPSPCSSPETSISKAVCLQCQAIIKNCLPQKEKSLSPGVYSLLESYRACDLQQIYHAFIKVYGQKTGVLLYRSVKPALPKIQTVSIKEILLY